VRDRIAAEIAGMRNVPVSEVIGGDRQRERERATA